MKYVCVKNVDTLDLTVGKVYTAATIKIKPYPYIYIQNDLSKYDWYYVELFKKIEDVRENKLNDLLK